MMFQLIVLMIELGFCIQIAVAETEYFPGKFGIFLILKLFVSV